MASDSVTAPAEAPRRSARAAEAAARKVEAMHSDALAATKVRSRRDAGRSAARDEWGLVCGARRAWRTMRC